MKYLAVAMAILSLGSVMPVVAQMAANSVEFKTSFPFYAGDTKMPAGSYRITQNELEENTVLIESRDHKYAAFVGTIPTQSEQTHAQTHVTFVKNGDAEYLDRMWVAGQRYGRQVDPTTVEKSTAANSNPGDHLIAQNKR